MKNILFLRNKIDVESRYNYAINYAWVDRGASEGLYKSFDWYIDDIPTVEELNVYIADNEIDCIISLCANEARFAEFLASDWWLHILYGATVPTLLRAADTYKDSWSDPFYQVWDCILYRWGDKSGAFPENGVYIPWCIDIERYTPVYGGEQIVMTGTCNEAYPLRMALRELNHKRGGALFLDICNMAGDLYGDKYIECLQNARAIITTAARDLPITCGRVLEAAACGTLVITPPTKYLDSYFDEDQVFIFNTGEEFIEVCERVKTMGEDAVIEKQRAAYEHVAAQHNCIKFIQDYILPAVDSATKEPK